VIVTSVKYCINKFFIAGRQMNGLCGKSCDQEVEVPAICHLAVFHAQAPGKDRRDFPAVT